jgi:8-amino-7-oxononanoate synthase
MPGPADELARLQSEGLLRSLRPLDSAAGPKVVRDHRELWNFASNDYLGLARHPAISAAIIEGVERYGAGSAASRLVCGSLPPHRQLEEALAAAKQCEAALTFSSGFATPLGLIPAVLGKSDFILLDKLSHACLVDAARLSGATMRVFPHNDCGKLRRLLESCRAKAPRARILVATESVFSMDGDLCPLGEIVGLVENFDAMLLLDEAHAFGVLGETGMGLAEREHLQGRITFQMGTLSKAAGLAGGYVAASRQWIDLLVNRARSLIYSTAPPPAIAHAAVASLDWIRSEEGRRLRGKLEANIKQLAGLVSPSAPSPATPILPIVLGTNEAAMAAASRLEDDGFLVPAIRYPTVPRGTARLRISLSAAHPPEALASLARSWSILLQSVPGSSPPTSTALHP